MAERESSRSIDAAAAEWVAREEHEPLSAEQQQELNTWLAGDIRRPGALLRARAVSLRSKSAMALGPHYVPEQFIAPSVPSAPSPQLSRRQLLTWGSAAAVSGAVAVGLGLGIGLGFRPSSAHATARGEIRLVPLADGSTMMLNTLTRVAVEYDETRRCVRLMRGEADFTVLEDSRRPFIVEVDGRHCRTTGGAFRVRRLDDSPLDVLVHQGRVDVMAAGEARPVVLETHTRLVMAAGASPLDESASPEPIAADVVTRELAWRNGKIAFHGETLAAAAEAFARYSDMRIVIDDPLLAREPVVGLYAANDPAGFSRGMAGLLGATVTQKRRTVVIARAPASVDGSPRR